MAGVVFSGVWVFVEICSSVVSADNESEGWASGVGLRTVVGVLDPVAARELAAWMLALVAWPNIKGSIFFVCFALAGTLL